MLKEKKAVLKRLLRPKVLVNTLKSYISYRLSLLFRKSIVWGLPPIVMIEPTSICNLKCPLCPSGTGNLKRKRGYLDFEHYQKVIEEIRETNLMLILWNQGEPLLHRDFSKMVRYAKDRGLFVMTSSNLNHLPDPESLVDSGLDTLIVSLDGASQETYNKYRINGSFQTVLSNTERLIDLKKQKKRTTPFIKWQFLIMKHNEQEVPLIKKLAAKMKVDDLSFKTVQIYEKPDIEQFLPIKEEYRRYKIEGDSFTLKKKIANRCRRIFTQPVINCDGEVAICCFDKDNLYKIGNIKNSSLKELWQGTKFQRWRNLVLQNRKKMGICLNCGEGIDLTVKRP